MSKVSPELLARCLEELESGRATLEEIVAAHPAEAEELRDLLELRLAIVPLPAELEPDPAFRASARVALLEAIAAERDRRRGLWGLFGPWVRMPALAFARLGAPLIAGLLLAFLVAAGGGVAYAAQDSLPGDALYGVKNALEQVQMALAASDEARAELHMALAAKRVEEVQRAAAAGRGDAARAAAEGFLSHVGQVETYVGSASASGKDVEALRERLQANLERQQAVLAEVLEKAPDSAKDAIQHAMEMSQKGLKRAQQAVQGPAGADAAGQGGQQVEPGRPEDTPGGRPEGRADLQALLQDLVATARGGNAEQVSSLVTEFLAALENEGAVLGKSSASFTEHCRGAYNRLEQAYERASGPVQEALLPALTALEECVPERAAPVPRDGSSLPGPPSDRPTPPRGRP